MFESSNSTGGFVPASAKTTPAPNSCDQGGESLRSYEIESGPPNKRSATYGVMDTTGCENSMDGH